MTPSDLRALLAAATPGPWKAGRNGPIAMVVSGYDPDRFPRQFRADCGISDADATLIAAAVNALPALLDSLASATERAEKAERRETALRTAVSQARLVVEWAADLAAGEADPMPRWPLDNLTRLAAEMDALLGEEG